MIEMRIYLILDEAGTSDELLKHVRIFTQIVDVSDGFPAWERLIMAGTRFEQASSSLSSSIQVFKYRMRAWENGKLEAAVCKKHGRDGTILVDSLIEVRVLQKLITNAQVDLIYTLDTLHLLMAEAKYEDIKLEACIGTMIV